VQIDLTSIDQIREIIQNYIYTNTCEYQHMKEQAEQGFAYYNNKDDIKITGAAAINEVNSFLKLKGSNPLHSADNRVSMNRHRVVVDQKVGYMFSAPPQFDLPADDTAPGDDATLKKVNDTTGSQWATVIKQLATDASNTSRAWLAYWQDNETKKFDYWYVNPLTCVPVYDRSTVKRKLLYLIRIYGYNDNYGNSCTRYEVWSDTQVAYLIRPETTTTKQPEIDFETLPNGDWNIQTHDYGRIPFIEFRNNAHAVPDLVMYKDIADAMDKLVSGFANDCDDIQEVLWVIKNYRGEENVPVYDKDGNILTDSEGNEIKRPVDVPAMLKAKKFVTVDADGGIDKLQNEIPFQARQAFRDILNDEFWTAAMAVNPNPDNTGNQSGVYIDHLYGLLELKSGLMETEFRNSIDEFLKAILHYLGASEDAQFVQTWKRTKPQNNAETADILSKLPDTVMSEETKTKNAPYVTDWQAERAQIKKEQDEAQKNTIDNLGGIEDQHTQHQGTDQQPTQQIGNDGGVTNGK
jgi:SPP1 family phage portal protein